jgi:hypothetical protein
MGNDPQTVPSLDLVQEVEHRSRRSTAPIREDLAKVQIRRRRETLEIIEAVWREEGQQMTIPATDLDARKHEDRLAISGLQGVPNERDRVVVRDTEDFNVLLDRGADVVGGRPRWTCAPVGHEMHV